MVGMPQEVTAVMRNVGHDNSECEDLAIGVLAYPEMLAQVTASIVAHDEGQQIIFQTEQARLSSPWKVAASKPLENGFPVDDESMALSVDAAYESLPSVTYERHAGQIHNVFSAIRGEEPLLIDGVQGRNTIELIMAIYKASVEKRTVALPIDKNDPLYTREGLVSSMPRFHEKKRSVENFATTDITLGKDADS
jgi:predicted dehydrogenase